MALSIGIMQNTGKGTHIYFQGLNLLRALSALAVVINTSSSCQWSRYLWAWCSITSCEIGFWLFSKPIEYLITLGKSHSGCICIIVSWAITLHSWQFLPKSFWVHAAVVITLSICIAAISYELFEKQILKWKKPFEVLSRANGVKN